MDFNAVDAAIAATVLPPVISVLNRCNWPAQLKGIVALVVCFVYATGAVFVRDGVDFSQWRDSALTVAGAALAAYKLWWQPSGIGPALENATTSSIGAHRAGAPVGAEATPEATDATG